MDKQIINVLDAMCEKFGVDIDWMQENIAPYLQELYGKYIRHEIVSSIFWFVAFASLTALSLYLAVKFHKKAKHLAFEYDFDEPVSWFAVVSWVCTVIFAIISVFVLIQQIYDIATALMFPEKMILDYAKTFLK